MDDLVESVSVCAAGDCQGRLTLFLFSHTVTDGEAGVESVFLLFPLFSVDEEESLILLFFGTSKDDEVEVEVVTGDEGRLRCITDTSSST